MPTCVYRKGLCMKFSCRCAFDCEQKNVKKINNNNTHTHMLLAAGMGAGLGVVVYRIARKRNATRLVCQIQGSGISGTIACTPADGGARVLAECDLRGVPQGLHGLHVHRHGSTTCADTCDHYNPDHQHHGGPLGPHRHRGDFGNVAADAHGRCTTVVLADVTLGELEGRSFVLHAEPDDLGLGDDPGSKTTGNAGKRLACGILLAVKGLKSPNGWVGACHADPIVESSPGPLGCGSVRHRRLERIHPTTVATSGCCNGSMPAHPGARMAAPSYTTGYWMAHVTLCVSRTLP